MRQFEAQVAAPAVTLAQSERATAVTEHNLNVLLGEGPTAIPRRGSLTAAVEALAIPDSIPAGLLARRPDVQQAERNYAAAHARIGVADAARLPTISIVGSLGVQAGVPNNVFGDQHARLSAVRRGFISSVRQRATVEPVRRGPRSRRPGEGIVRIDGAERDPRSERRTRRRSCRARSKSPRRPTQARALRQALDLAESRYEAGLSSYLDLLDAQRSLFSAELALSQAQLGELTAAVQLYKALGGTWNTR